MTDLESSVDQLRPVDPDGAKAWDIAATVFLALCAAMLIAGGATGQLYWQYYPYVTGTFSAWSVATCAIYALGCGLPLLIKWKEEAQWRSLTFDN